MAWISDNSFNETKLNETEFCTEKKQYNPYICRLSFLALLVIMPEKDIIHQFYLRYPKLTQAIHTTTNK